MEMEQDTAEPTLLNQLGAKVFRVKEIGPLIGLVVIMIVFSILSDKFLRWGNINGILTMTAELGIVAVGVCMLMIAGEFDLSVGSIYAVIPMVGALLANAGVPYLLAFILALGTAVLIGLFNGFIVLKTGIPSFIVTLGGLMFYRGVILAVSGGFPIKLDSDNKVVLLEMLGTRIEALGYIRASSLWLIGVTALFTIVLTSTKFGNHVSAVGGNRETAKAVGIDVRRIKYTCFALSSVMAGLAGFTMFGRFYGVAPTAGNLMELEAIAACVIGGALLKGGYGSIVGAFIGALLVAVLRSGLILAGAPAYWYRGFIGVVLVIAVIMNTKIRTRIVGE
ncbi:MAG: ABC transporter permease [Spirochaetaceae bacterium]